jgi:hypothetical protein
MRKMSSAAAAFAAIGALAFTGIATAGGGERANTTVTIKGGGEVFGYVKSPKPRKCAKERKVALYDQQGANQNPQNDEKVLTDTTDKVGDRYQWSAGNPGSGDFYAKVRKTDDCKGDTSKTIAN